MQSCHCKFASPFIDCVAATWHAFTSVRTCFALAILLELGTCCNQYPPPSLWHDVDLCVEDNNLARYQVEVFAFAHHRNVLLSHLKGICQYLYVTSPLLASDRSHQESQLSRSYKATPIQGSSLPDYTATSETHCSIHSPQVLAWQARIQAKHQMAIIFRSRMKLLLKERNQFQTLVGKARSRRTKVAITKRTS